MPRPTGKLRVRVTRRHLATGEPCACNDCPVALAIGEAILEIDPDGDPCVDVGVGYARDDGSYHAGHATFDLAGHRLSCPLPARVVARIDAIDDNDPGWYARGDAAGDPSRRPTEDIVRPFRFSLDLDKADVLISA